MPTRGTRQIELDVQLLVEGNDDRNFFEAMAGQLGLRDVQVQDFGGVNGLRGFLAGFVNMPGFARVRRLGIVRDAEKSATSAFQSVQSSLTNAGLPVAERPLQETAGNPTVSVLMLPDGSSPGLLETLLCRTFAATPVDRCIDDMLGCIRIAGVETKRPEKARAHLWLATRPDPHLSVGVAAKRGYWDLDHPALADVRAFLAALCRSDAP